MNSYVWYAYERILNRKISGMKQKIILSMTNVVVTVLACYIEFNINSFLSGIILCLVYGAVLCWLTKKKFRVFNDYNHNVVCAIVIVPSH